MKHLLLGAALGLLWLLVGVPLTPALVVLAAVVRPYVPGTRRWAR